VAGPDGRARWVREDEFLDSDEARNLEGSRRWLALESGFLPSGKSFRAHGEIEPTKSPFARLLEITQPERSDVIAIILYSAFSGLMTLAIPIAVQQLVNTVAFGGLVQPVVVLALLLLLGLAIAAVLYASQAILAELFQQRVFVRACLDLAHRLPRVSEYAFGHRSAPAFVNRFFDLVTIQKTGARLLLEGSSVMLQTATGLFVLSFYHPLMLALSIFLLGAMAIASYSFGRSAPSSALQESSAKYDLAAWMEELVRHPTLFRTTAGRARAESRADGLITRWVTARQSHYRIVFRQFVAALGLQVIVNTGLLALGGFLVVAGELTLGQLVASEIIVASVVASFARLAKHFESYYDLLAAVGKVGDLFDLPLERTSIPVAPIEAGVPARIDGHDITLRDAARTVVEKFSIAVEAGERVALSGSSEFAVHGLLEVLAGLREPDTGYVTLDDRDLRDESPEHARNRILMIRDPQLLPATVLENLTVGAPEASLDDIENALRRVGLLDEIRRLPDGLQTRLQSGGDPLVRSQTLKLEIARALLAQPSVLLLDLQTGDFGASEMSPALDAIFEPETPWTVIAVSADSAIATRCERRVCLDEGRAVGAPLRPVETPPNRSTEERS
jgi:ABC-type bacteriocin/lantibiotic exporter with double-glycine peptidase domain